MPGRTLAGIRDPRVAVANSETSCHGANAVSGPESRSVVSPAQPREPPGMRAIEISQPGGPEVLRLTERADPEPGPGEVRIRVFAAGVNRPDCLQRAGKYPPPAGASDLPGLEVAGIVDAVGPAVSEWTEGDAVFALVAGGGYAERCLAPEGQCLKKPDSLSWVDAATLPETLFTVWANVFEAGGLRTGEVLLVHGGTSGIGTMSIQLAKQRGCRIAVTCRGESKCEFARQLGADLAVDYADRDFVAAIASNSELGGGVDVVLDMVGGDYVARNLELLRPGGRHVSIAFLRGATTEVGIVPIMRKRLVLTGSTLRARSNAEKRRLRNTIREELGRALEHGRLGRIVSHRLPLSEAAEAHRVMEAGEHRGKIALEVAPPAFTET